MTVRAGEARVDRAGVLGGEDEGRAESGDRGRAAVRSEDHGLRRVVAGAGRAGGGPRPAPAAAAARARDGGSVSPERAHGRHRGPIRSAAAG
ncbi:hypothetical protein GCM10010421_53030 [Streptomyces glaucus]|uniref:Uncharacterized protein n=1 Tax=Streptomyces glaucus TaxID=284029 RepID=A0ABP5XJJ2_9ACTN